jgi:flagellar biosynthetic protein FlhB
MADDEEKTEEPTPKRRDEARKKGQVAKSQDLTKAALMLAGMGLIYALGGGIRTKLGRFMGWCFENIHTVNFSEEGINSLLLSVISLVIGILAPFAIGLLFFVLVACILQVGLKVSFETLKPNFGKLDPIKGFKNIFSTSALMRVVMSLLKLAVIGTVLYYAIANEIEIVFALHTFEVVTIFAIIGDMVFWMVVKMAIAMLVLAIIDLIYQRYNHEKQLKMSHQEIKDEMKQSEGDPQVKARIHRKMMENTFKRMMASVPEADVVVANPTHFAIALKYDAAISDAPIVIAKGQRLIAKRIKELAKEAGIPIVEDKPLARALFKTVEVGEQVPPALFRAVAKLLGYIYRMKNKKKRGGLVKSG